MQSGLIAVIFFVLYLSAGVLGDDDIKRGTFQFMAFVYYQDETVVDGTGARFLQAGVLIRPNFLISSSFSTGVIQDPLSKTLLARLGAIHIDANFTFNGDEDEQEEEIIQIIHPHQHNRTNWWETDISLLKTLQPFMKTSAVHVTQLSTGRDYSDKICNIIVFKKKSLDSAAEGLFLSQLPVEMLPASSVNCGEQFVENTMICATDPALADEKAPVADFCQGNSGGPLICDNDVMALQTYINGNCNPPHLYQLLAPWRNFLSCGTADNCNDKEKCLDVCSVTFKDDPTTETTTASTFAVTEATTTQVAVVSTTEDNNVSETSDTTTTTTTIHPLPDDSAVTTTTTEEPLTPTPTPVPTTSTFTTTTATAEVTQTETTSIVNDTESQPWPRERASVKEPEEAEDIKVEQVRSHKIEAQRKMLSVHSVANKNACVIQSLIFSVFVMWICLV